MGRFEPCWPTFPPSQAAAQYRSDLDSSRLCSSNVHPPGISANAPVEIGERRFIPYGQFGCPVSLLQLLNEYTEKKVDCLCCATASRRVGARDAGWKYPADGVWEHWWPVTAQAPSKVDAIRHQALSLGWSEAQLYKNRCWAPFPWSPDYGLVCFLGGDREVGRITPDAIEIIEESRTHPPGWPSFYYPDVGHHYPAGSPS